jgi:hypothetical protein
MGGSSSNLGPDGWAVHPRLRGAHLTDGIDRDQRLKVAEQPPATRHEDLHRLDGSQFAIAVTSRLRVVPPVIVGVRNKGPCRGGEDPVPLVPNLPRRGALAQLCTFVLPTVKRRYSTGARSTRSRRASTRALRKCKHETFTVNRCHSLPPRHVGVTCNLTRSDARNA